MQIFFFHCDGIAVILSSSSKARELTLWGLGLGGKKKTSSAHVVCSCHACPSPAAKWSTAQETLEPLIPKPLDPPIFELKYFFSTQERNHQS